MFDAFFFITTDQTHVLFSFMATRSFKGRRVHGMRIGVGVGTLGLAGPRITSSVSEYSHPQKGYYGLR